MQITKDKFREILSEVLSDDFYNYDSFLKIVDIEFTDKVPTLSVSIEERPTMKINIDFMNRHCKTVEHVKALIFHELLHITLGHNLIIPEDDSKALINNIAFDCVINMIIHKIKGNKYSSVMTNIYSQLEDKITYILMPYQKNFTTENFVLDDIWRNLYQSNNISQSDIINVLEDIIKKEIYVPLIGNHSDGISKDSEDIKKESDIKAKSGIKIKENTADKIKGFNNKSQAVVNNEEENYQKLRGDADYLNNIEMQTNDMRLMLSWKIKIYKSILRFLEDSKSRVKNSKGDYDFFSPVLNNKDRRSFIKSMWNDNFVFSRWTTIKNIDSKQANVYIDLSGSMTQELPYIISVLFKLKMYIKNPFWAFSNKVEKAKFKGNKLISKTTGGTSIIPVFEHIKEKKAKKAIIVTDGYFESYFDSNYESIKPESDILFILVPDSSEDEVKSWGFKYIKVDSLVKNDEYENDE
jgi:predicted metal-dependent peptidase